MEAHRADPETKLLLGFAKVPKLYVHQRKFIHVVGVKFKYRPIISFMVLGTKKTEGEKKKKREKYLVEEHKILEHSFHAHDLWHNYMKSHDPSFLAYHVTKNR